MILFRYFAREVYTTTLVVTLVVLVIAVSFRFNGYLAEASRGELTREVLFPLVLFKLPGFLELVLPGSFFLSILLTYSRFHAQNEMVILETSGLGPANIVAITLLLAVTIVFISGGIALWLKPLAEAKVENLFKSQRRVTELTTLIPGRFQMDNSGNRVTYVEHMLTGRNNLEGIFINVFTAGTRSLSTTTVAQQGTSMLDDQGNLFLILHDGSRYSGTPSKPNYQVIKFDEFGQLIEKGKAQTRKRRRTAISTIELINNPSNRNLSELHWRISNIVMTILLSLLAIPLSNINPRAKRHSSLIFGMVICFGYILTLGAARSALENGSIPIEFGLWWVHILAGAMVVALNKLVPLLKQ